MDGPEETGSIMQELESILYFLDQTLQVSGFPDYPHALNGLQVAGPRTIRRVGAAVDASEETIEEAVRRGVDLLIVHHGLFWDGLGPLTGPRYRKVAALIRGGVALYSSHLPLDAHPDLGNAALLTRSLGLVPEGPFGSFKEIQVGCRATARVGRDELLDRLSGVVGMEARLIAGGPGTSARVGVLTGSGASALVEAAEAGLDTLVTGEAPHHAYHQAMELGINLLLGGHYATETFGVKAVSERLAREFSLAWEFLHFPTGF
jgi:dinuclear metal center YbgI/SA1388 family protein